jgi:hypothetical protein
VGLPERETVVADEGYLAKKKAQIIKSFVYLCRIKRIPYGEKP